MSVAVNLFGELYTPGLHYNANDMVGAKIGKLTVLRVAGNANDNHLNWICRCECGNEKEIASNSLNRANPVRTCGCANAETAQTKRLAGGAWNEGKSYAILDGEHCYKNRAAWSKAVIRHYGNTCMRCGWDEARCDAHHIVPKAQGGLNTIANGKVLCPNCHRVEHEGEKHAAR